MTITASITSGILFYFYPTQHPTILNGTTIQQTNGRQNFTPTVVPTVQITSLIESPIVTATDSSYQQSPTQISTSFQHVIFAPTLTLQSSIPIPSKSISSVINPTDILAVTPLPIISSSITPLTLPQDNNPPPLITPSGIVSSPPNLERNGLNADVIFNLVNNYRKTVGLITLEKDSKTCLIAQERAPQIYNEIFITHDLDYGLKQLNLPYWITEVIINDDTENNAINWWLNDDSHKKILTGNYTYSCAACSGFNCVQVFTNYISK